MKPENKLNCVSYRVDSDQDGFYFSELTTLDVSVLLDAASEISQCKIFAYSRDKAPDSDFWSTIKTIEEFNRFFVNNADYYIHDAELTFVDGSKLSSHDDGEVHISFGPSVITPSIVSRILYIKGLPVELEHETRMYPNYFLSIGASGQVVGKYPTFESYLLSLR